MLLNEKNVIEAKNVNAALIALKTKIAKLEKQAIELEKELNTKTSVKVVDTVESGNMNAVTSNAVNGEINKTVKNDYTNKLSLNWNGNNPLFNVDGTTIELLRNGGIASLISFSVNNGYGICQIIPWEDGVHIRTAIDDNNYADILWSMDGLWYYTVVNGTYDKYVKLV